MFDNNIKLYVNNYYITLVPNYIPLFLYNVAKTFILFNFQYELPNVRICQYFLIFKALC